MVGWPCPVLTFLWADYKGVQGKLLCYCLQPWYLIACYSGALQSQALSYNINLDFGRNCYSPEQLLYGDGSLLKCHLSKHNWRPLPFPKCDSHPDRLIEIQVFRKGLCGNDIFTTSTKNCSFWGLPCYFIHWGEMGIRTVQYCQA